MKKILLIAAIAFNVFGCAHHKLHKHKEATEALEKVAQDYYRTYNNRDIQGQLNLMNEDVIYVGNSGKIRTGKEAYRKHTESLYAEVNEKVMDLKYFVDFKQSVVVAQSNCIGTYDKASEGMPPARGQQYTLPVVEIFEVKDGKISKLSTFYNEDLFTQQILEPKKK